MSWSHVVYHVCPRVPGVHAVSMVSGADSARWVAIIACSMSHHAG